MLEKFQTRIVPRRSDVEYPFLLAHILDEILQVEILKSSQTLQSIIQSKPRIAVTANFLDFNSPRNGYKKDKPNVEPLVSRY